jgi:threonine aldolase
MPAAARPIDLRSDTVTRPDAPMLEAMVRAPLGDDVFGDDPTAQELETLSAGLTGKEAALFVPSGTMGNAIAVGVHCRPGDEVVLEALCHTYNFECAGSARLWGVQAVAIPGERGQIPLERLARAVRPDDVHLPRTRLVVLEETANIPGGCVLPLEYLREVGAFCRARGLRFHLDGARIFNASVASGVPVREYAACADSLMFCVSKGLGAPAGSLVAGDRGFIQEARRLRKLLGGGLRQAGILAACGLYALRHNVERLADDHRRARELAASLAPLAARGLDVSPPETNMVFLRWPGSDPERYARTTRELAADGVLAVGLRERGIRLVFHKDVDDEAAARAGEILGRRLEVVLRS